MHIYRLIVILFFLCFTLNAQHKSSIIADLDDTNKTLEIVQNLEYLNTSKDTLSEIYFMDWANAFSSKETPLAIRFNEDFKRAFHFSSEKDRGYTTIQSVTINTENSNWFRPEKAVDILGITLKTPLLPNQKIKFKFKYLVKIPSDRYTRFGFSKEDYKIKFWHLTPAIYNKGWQTYSHKNLNDFTSQFSDYTLQLSIPEKYRVESNLKATAVAVKNSKNVISLNGKNISNIKLYIESNNVFYQTHIGNKTISSDIPREGMDATEVETITKKTFNFIEKYFGEIPQEKILLSYKDYLKQPIYGFNQLPKSIRPFNKGFQFEITTLKQLMNEVKKGSFISHLRNEQWFSDALQVYVMIKYVEEFYPEATLAGRLSNFFGIRWFHAADLKFNDQYYIGYKNMAARFLEQPLGKTKDSLLKFNYKISNSYKAGMGLHYLESYLKKGELDAKIKEFISESKLKPVTAKNFNDKLKKNASKNINWFTEDFVYLDTITDVKIRRVSRTKDSIFIHLKNKGKQVPVKVTALKKKTVITSKWSPVFSDTSKIAFARKKANHFVIDYDERLPEFSRRNNYFKTTGLFHKRFQFRLFQDIEYPKYSQIYTVPVYDFNVYDGLILGARFLNKSLTPRKFNINFVPSYGVKSNEFQGSFSLGYTHKLRNYGWSFLNYSISGSTSSYAPGLSFTRYTPSINLIYRPKDFRKNISQSIRTRFVSIDRERNPDTTLETPNYNIFNARYNYSDNNLTHVLGFNFDYQSSKNFNRISTTFNYRKLFLNNRQVNFRVFAGTFLNNKTSQEGDFFSFALDRPSDYLFDFGYFARDDNSGLASQQFITAEGNFKSRFINRFANQWITTTSIETNIWNWIFIYANGGLIKSKGADPRALYDSGIRLNLVQDYFELYFPLQSSLGFEPSFNDYSERIRFKATLSIDTLFKLFTREWY